MFAGRILLDFAILDARVNGGSNRESLKVANCLVVRSCCPICMKITQDVLACRAMFPTNFGVLWPIRSVVIGFCAGRLA